MQTEEGQLQLVLTRWLHRPQANLKKLVLLLGGHLSCSSSTSVSHLKLI
jgi:hypothetical protein